jgi:diguanylate cyclase (GGDEF)-like protein
MSILPPQLETSLSDLVVDTGLMEIQVDATLSGDQVDAWLHEHLPKEAARSEFKRLYRQTSSPLLQVAVLTELGNRERQQGDLRYARGVLLRAAHKLYNTGEPQRAAQNFIQVAHLERQLGRFDDAKTHLKMVLNLAHHTKDSKLESEARSGLASVELMQGNFVQALSVLQQTLELQRITGDQKQLAKTLTNTGLTYIKLGEYEIALRHLFDGYSLVRSLDDPKLNISVLVNIGLAFENLEDLQNAREYYARALEASQTFGDPILLLINTLNLGQLDRKVGDLDRAAARFMEVLHSAKETGFQQGQIAARDGLGMVARQQGHFDVAVAHHQKALELAHNIQDREGELEAWLHLGRNHLDVHAPELAQHAASQALGLASQMQSVRGQFEAHQLLSQVHQAQGSFEQALLHHQQFFVLRSQAFNEERDRQTRLISARFDLERARTEAEMYRLRTVNAQQARNDAEMVVRQRTLELQKSQIEIVTRLAVAAEYRDDRTGEHTLRVGHYSALIAQQLGWKEPQVRLLRLAARLHDVGKIGIPDDILLKPSKLSSEEFEQMKQHTVIGSKILSGGRSKLLRLAERIAISHHEQWNGQGYPYNLPGEVIPLEGRIVAVADVYDALTQARPYKRAWRPLEALQQIERSSGRQFDPNVVQAAVRALSDPKVLELPQDFEDDADFQVLALDEDESELLRPFESRIQDQIHQLEQAKLEAELRVNQLEQSSFVDTLTSLNNRKAFELDLENEQSRAKRHSHALHVVAVELDGVIITNERSGKGMGTQLLRQFATLLEQHYAQLGRAYRLSSSEFALLIETAVPLEPVFFEQNLKHVLAELHQAQFVYANAHIGVANSVETEDLLSLSQQRLNLSRMRQHRHFAG